MRPFGWTLALLSGAVWGMAFWSWGLPMPIPMRVVATALLLVALPAASRAGALAAAGFALGMGASSGLLLAVSGQLFVEWWGLVPASALVAGVGLLAHGALRDLSRLDPSRPGPVR